MKNLKIHITKSWRKSISMKFDTQGVLLVKAPMFMSRTRIDEFLKKHVGWIEQQQQKIEEQKVEKKWYLFGEELHINQPGIFTSKRPHPNPLPKREGTSFKGGELQPHLLPLGEEWGGGLIERIQEGGFMREGIKKHRESFYKSQAKKYIPARCEFLAEKYDFSFEKIRITSAKTRWGSCSSKKTLNFSYRLVMAPKEAIDYVIIHELCHLRQMNHSVKFWQEVARIFPEYKKQEQHLKEFGWRYRV